MMIIGGQGEPSLYAAISSLGLTSNLKLCLDAGDQLSYQGGSLSATFGPQTLGTSGVAASTGINIRQLIPASQISTSGSKVVVTFGADGGGTFQCTGAYIVEQASSGDPYDYAGAPTQLTFGGNAGFTITDSQIISSDPCTFALDETKNYLVAFYCPSSAVDDIGTAVTVTGCVPYYKIAANELTTQNASGYTDWSGVRNLAGVYSIHVVASGNGGQFWADRSGQASHFVRGTVGISDSADPTFNGSIGGLTQSEYWSFDGGDYFSIAAAENPSWVQPFHKDGATFTIMFAMYGPVNGSGAMRICADGSTTRPGFDYTVNGTTGVLQFNQRNGGGGAAFNSTLTVPSNGWFVAGISISENAGAAGGIHFANGSSETFNPSYSSPSASDAGFPILIGKTSVETVSGTRMAWMAIWNAALTAQNMQAIYNAVRGRFGI